MSLGSGLWVPVSLSSHQGGRQGGARVAGNVGDNIGFWTIGLVMIFMRWWWMSRTTGRCKRLNFFFVLAAKIIQALDSKPGSCNQTFHQQNVICHG